MKISGREQVYKITKSRDTEKPTLDIKTASKDPNQSAHTRSIIGILTVRKETKSYRSLKARPEHIRPGRADTQADKGIY